MLSEELSDEELSSEELSDDDETDELLEEDADEESLSAFGVFPQPVNTENVSIVARINAEIRFLFMPTTLSFV